MYVYSSVANLSSNKATCEEVHGTPETETMSTPLGSQISTWKNDTPASLPCEYLALKKNVSVNSTQLNKGNANQLEGVEADVECKFEPSNSEGNCAESIVQFGMQSSKLSCSEGEESAGADDAPEAQVSEYEKRRLDNMMRNVEELRRLGLHLSLETPIQTKKKKRKTVSGNSVNPTNICHTQSQNQSNSEKIHEQAKAVQVSGKRSVTSNVRRSGRRIVKRKLFANIDYSKKAVAMRHLKKFVDCCSVAISLVEDSLIDKLAAEAYVQTKKAASMDMESAQAAPIAEDENMDDLEAAKRKKRAIQRKKRMEKAEKIFEQVWMPKGSRCKIVWTLKYHDRARDPFEDEVDESSNENMDADDMSAIKTAHEENKKFRQSYGEEAHSKPIRVSSTINLTGCESITETQLEESKANNLSTNDVECSDAGSHIEMTSNVNSHPLAVGSHVRKNPQMNKEGQRKLKNQQRGRKSVKRTMSKRILQDLLCKLCSLPASREFRAPVDWKGIGANDYLDVIKTPMDLKTVRSKVNKGSYKSMREFAEDVNLVFDNALTYNKSETESFPIRTWAMELKEYFNQEFKNCLREERKNNKRMELWSLLNVKDNTLPSSENSKGPMCEPTSSIIGLTNAVKSYNSNQKSQKESRSENAGKDVPLWEALTNVTSNPINCTANDMVRSLATISVYHYSYDETESHGASSSSGLDSRDRSVSQGQEEASNLIATKHICESGQVEARESTISESSDDTSSTQIETKLRKRRIRKNIRSIIQQKDFYAILVQQEKGRKEHLYNITNDLQLTEVIRDNMDRKHPFRKLQEDEEPIELDEKTLQGVVYWTVPLDIQPGSYKLEIGSNNLGTVALTLPFRVTEAFGIEDVTTVGVWCICSQVHAASLKKGTWVSCSVCHSWQHWSCYQRQRAGKAKQKMIEKLRQDLVVLAQKKKNNRNDGAYVSSSSQQEENIKRRLAKAEHDQFIIDMERLEREIFGHPAGELLPNENADFCCWMCYKYTPEDLERYHEVDLSNLRNYRIKRMIGMINNASGGYSRRKLGKSKDGKEIKRQYCTPNHVVCFLGVLLNRLESGRGQRTYKYIDLGAGLGRLCSILPRGSKAVEIEQDRYKKGKTRTPWIDWLNQDVLSMDFYQAHYNSYDIVVSNPDFEVALPFIVVGFHLLRKANKDARLYYILPSDFFEASALRSRIFKLLDFKIEVEYKLGHLTYLESDPLGQKLTVDSLFVLKLGRKNKFQHRVVNARLAGML